MMAAKKVQFSGFKVSTQVVQATEFYAAHFAHQEYLAKNQNGYCNHRVRLVWEE
jgi:peptide methionine sulfoxide reductase MsrA